MKVGVIGAGVISDIYLENMIHMFDNLTVIAVSSVPMEGAIEKAKKYGIEARTTEEIFVDPEIEAAVILTPVGTHYELIKQALLSGKHVYTEKTIASNTTQAKELCCIADEKGLYLGSAPDTFLGAAAQTAKQAIDSGMLGEIHSFDLSVTRNNSILLSLFSILREPGCGLLHDYLVYYLTTLISILGPVETVNGICSCPYPKHRNIIPGKIPVGQEMDTPNESQVSAVIRLKNGIVGTLHGDADCNSRDEAYFSIYGTKGILYLPNANEFGGRVQFVPNVANPRQPARKIQLEKYFPYSHNSRGLGVSDMADAIKQGKHNRASKELALHVLEVLESILISSRENGGTMEMKTTCEIPKIMETKKVPTKNIGHPSFNMKNNEEMLHFYRDVLGMKEQFTLTMGQLIESKMGTMFKGELTEEQKKEKARLEHVVWMTYLRMADRQYVELFYNLGNWTRTIEDRNENYGFTKVTFETEDIDALRIRLMECDTTLKEDVHTTVDGSRELSLYDPDGNEVVFVEYAPEKEERIPLTKDQFTEKSAFAKHTTQMAYTMENEENMLAFYERGIGLKRALTLTVGDMVSYLRDHGQSVQESIQHLPMDNPWMEYMEVAPHQYLVLYHNLGQKKKEDRDLTDAYGYQHICIEVQDIHAAWDAVKANGLIPDTEISLGADGAYQFWLTDPDGNRLEMMEYAPGAKQLDPVK